MRISDWSSDVCSSELGAARWRVGARVCSRRGPVVWNGANASGSAPLPGCRRGLRGGVEKVAWKGAGGGDDAGEALVAGQPGEARSEDRRVGNVAVRTCHSRWLQYHSKQNNKT